MPRSFSTALFAAFCASLVPASFEAADEGATAECPASDCRAGAVTALPLESEVGVEFCARTGPRPISAAQQRTHKKCNSFEFMARSELLNTP